jgi:transposase
MMGVFLMSKRCPTSIEVKLHAVQRCLAHKSNPNYEAKHLGVRKGTVNDWIRKYETDDLDGLKKSATWKTYSKELKFAAVHDVLSGHYSLVNNKLVMDTLKKAYQKNPV